jgi:hypothetical protein
MQVQHNLFILREVVMSSSNWSVAKKGDAASRFSNRMQRLLESASFRAESRRNNVAVDLSVAVAESNPIFCHKVPLPIFP